MKKGKLDLRGATFWFNLAAVPCAIGCSAPSGEAGADEAESAAIAAPLTSATNPAFAKKWSSPGTYNAQETLAQQLETHCGGNDLQLVNAYTGTLGPSVGFVQEHKTAVGAMAASSSSGKYCSGTLVARDLFLTASHCVDSSTVGQVVSFNYERSGGPGSGLLTESFYTISAVVHDSSALDFALLRLSGDPGSSFPWTPLSSSGHGNGTAITLIQHPDGRPKEIEAGSISSQSTDYYNYGDVDTEGGSSGSGILNDAGELIGVHTNGGCTMTGGSNSGIRVARALQLSADLAALAGVTPTVLAGDFNGDGRADLIQAFRGWGSLPRCVSTGSSYSCSNPGATMYDWGSSEQQFLTGDFNGDGKKDVIQAFSRWGSIPTCYSTAAGYSCSNPGAAIYDADSAEQRFVVADVDGNGLSDVLQTFRRWGSIPMCKSTGSGYSCSNPSATIYDSGSTEQEFLAGDFNGDGKGDVIQTFRGWGSIPLCLSTGSGWNCSNPGASIFNSGSAEQRFLVGDFDGDGKQDVVQTFRGWGSIPLCKSTGSGWTCSNPAASIFNSGSAEQRFLVGDFNGDGKKDVAQVFRGWGSIPVCLSTGSGWSCGNWPATIYNSGSAEQEFRVADINGDGRDDVVQSYRGWSSYPTCLSTGSGWNCNNTPATIYNAGP
jgi:V8-like Glu-specific endopeptidase